MLGLGPWIFADDDAIFQCRWQRRGDQGAVGGRESARKVSLPPRANHARPAFATFRARSRFAGGQGSGGRREPGEGRVGSPGMRGRHSVARRGGVGRQADHTFAVHRVCASGGLYAGEDGDARAPPTGPQKARPSTAIRFTVSRSNPSRQRRLIAAVSVPSGCLPSPNGWHPQVGQN